MLNVPEMDALRSSPKLRDRVMGLERIVDAYTEWCAICQGWGLENEGECVCPTCKGLGRVPKQRRETCPACGGDHEKERPWCKLCGEQIIDSRGTVPETVAVAWRQREAEAERLRGVLAQVRPGSDSHVQIEGRIRNVLAVPLVTEEK